MKMKKISVFSVFLIFLLFTPIVMADDIEINFRGGIGLHIEVTNNNDESKDITFSIIGHTLLGLERLNTTDIFQIDPHSTIEWSIGQFRPITKGHAIVECGDTMEEQDALFLGIFVLLL